ncbi:MAG: hypothetical protein KGY50_00330 [Candidatus Thermoplasmatota archaeon]|nr:hypothetical protein [Candidatus Thermoplasmatota archaeon]
MFILNKNAVSILQDTLLFLVFISIAAMILSPAVLQNKSFYFSSNEEIDNQVEETLQTVLSTTTNNYSYEIGSQVLDPLAESFGINTSRSESLYTSLTNHFLGKQQSHKTISQLISEHLATQYWFKLNNSVIHLNPFSGNSHQQLTNLITRKINNILPPMMFFNCTAIWQPIHNVSFGGKINVGEPIPETVSTYNSNQKISLPILPCISIKNSSFCFSSYHLKNKAEIITKEISSFQNISKLHNQSINITDENKTKIIVQNISSFLENLIFYGIKTENDTILFPSVFDVLFSKMFSNQFFSLTQLKNANVSLNSFSTMNSFFDSFPTINNEGDNSFVTSNIISHFAKTISEKVNGIIWSSVHDFLSFLKQSLLQLIHPIIVSISDQLTTLFMLNKQPVLTFFDNLVETVFSHLSLTTASISLTIWRR